MIELVVKEPRNPSVMALSDTDRLLRSYRAHIRDLQDDVEFLKGCLWNAANGDHPALHEDCDHDAPILTREEEQTGTTGGEDMIKAMLEL